MKVAIFGSTGFVGSYIINQLFKNNFTPKTLIRTGSESKIVSNCELVHGNIMDKNAISNTMEGTDAIIYNIGIIRQFPKQNILFEKLHFQGVKDCIEIATKKNIKRFILMSANGVKQNGTEYQYTKWKADSILQQSNLNWTIFRPSLIFGNPKGHGRPEFCTQIKKDLLSLPFPAPLFYKGIIPINAGKFSLTPIHVENVAEFFVNSINMESTHGKIYNLGGPDILTWKNIIHQIAIASKKRTWAMPAPVNFIKLIAQLFDQFTWFPVTKEQLIMLLEGNIVKERYFKEFSINPKTFTSENLTYLSE